MTDEIKPTDDDVRDALKLLRALTGAEPYAPHVMPTAREIARIVNERKSAIVRDWLSGFRGRDLTTVYLGASEHGALVITRGLDAVLDHLRGNVR